MEIQKVSDGNISLCHKYYCYNATGQKAKVLTVGILALILIISISSLSNNNQK